MISYRPMVLADYDDCYELWSQLDGIGLSSADSHASIKMFLNRNRNMSQVACDGDKIIGTALCGHDGRRGYLHHLAVSKQYQRRGIGQELFLKCFEALANEGIKKSHIFVVSENREAIEFWKEMGWEHREYLILMSKLVENNKE